MLSTFIYLFICFLLPKIHLDFQAKTVTEEIIPMTQPLATQTIEGKVAARWYSSAKTQK